MLFARGTRSRFVVQRRCRIRQPRRFPFGEPGISGRGPKRTWVSALHVSAFGPSLRSPRCTVLLVIGVERTLVDAFGVLSPHAMKYFITQVQSRIKKRVAAISRATLGRMQQAAE